ncbi:MAG: secretin N-terminal domain-containing protein, partial [Planctomycetota bacterium]
MLIRVVVPVVSLIALFGAAGLALAQEEKEPKTARTEDRIEIDFRDMTLKDLFDLMEETNGIAILYPQTLGGQTVYASGVRSMTHKQLLSVFQAILELHGHTLVSVPVWPGVIIQKVVQSPHGRNYPSPTFSKKEIMEDPSLLEGRQDMVTVIYPLRYAQAMNVQSQFRQLIDPRGGTIFGIPNVDVLVLTDFAPSVRRMVEIMNLMDVPGSPLSMEVIFLEHALADDVVPILDQLTQITRDFRQQRGGGQGPRGSETSFVTDERTNSIIVNGPREVIDNLKVLVRQIDVKLDKEPSRIHIYRLKHTNAEDVGATVNALLQSVSLRQLETAYTGAPGAGPAPRPPPGPGPTPVPVQRPRSGSTGRYGEEERAAAIADKVSNSLIVVAGEAEYAVIRKIIESLDIRRPVVLIEVVVMEVSEGEGFNLGVELTTLDGAHDDSTRGFAATRFGFSNLVDEDGSPLMGPGIPRGQIPSATQGSVVGIHRGKEWRIPAIVNLIGSESTVNVMSLPRIVTNDNKEAKLKVTDNVPYATASSTASSASQNFGGFKEAGIEITITPHISEGGYLRLELDQS